jgi:RimJ/RimL family protein N-acetyltransferase
MIVTSRLCGVPLAASDLPELLVLHRDQRVLSAFGAEPDTDDDTRRFLARKLAHWREYGFGIWMFRDPAGAFIGRCGIHRWRDDVELGYIVEPSFWGQGFATEMAAAVAGHAFTTLGLSSLVAFTREENIASRRVMEKVGFLYERDFLDEGVQNVLYRLQADSFHGL